MVNSWDCFDTLIARRFYNPHSVFDEVGRRLNIFNFRDLRIKAELSSDNTYSGIYKNLPGIDPSIELDVELEHCFPIVENINKVKDGDLIVSDIFHTSATVEKLLKKCGLTKNVKFFVTPDGKNKGWIWSTLPKINLHTGDNKKSDVKSAIKHNVNATLYTECHLNDVETLVQTRDSHLAMWMRYIRLHCPYADHHMKTLWQDQSNYNLPILALASLELPDTPLAFIHRDCVFWQKIYESITGNLSVRFDASRIVLENPTAEYKKFVSQLLQSHSIVDLQGTGTSLLSFFNNDIPPVYFIASGKLKKHKNLHSISNDCNYAIEKHNCSAEGTLLSWDNNGPIRAPIEHDPIVIKVQHEAFAVAISSIKYFKFKKNLELLKLLLTNMKSNYTNNTVQWTDNHK